MITLKRQRREISAFFVIDNTVRDMTSDVLCTNMLMQEVINHGSAVYYTKIYAEFALLLSIILL